MLYDLVLHFHASDSVRNGATRWFGFVKGVYGVSEELFVLGFAIMPWSWQYAIDVAQKIGFWADSEIFHSILYVIITSTVKMVLDLPWSVYGTFVLEQRHGFNKETVGVFVGDLVKQVLN